MSIPFWTLVFLAGLEGGASLRCFNCSTDNDDDCVFLHPSDTRSPFYTPCSGSCVLTTVVERAKSRTVRTCAREVHHDGCIAGRTSTTLQHNNTCYCNTDGCNGEEYGSVGGNMTGKVRSERADDLPPEVYCYHCTTRSRDKGCEDITADTRGNSPYYYLCPKGACGLVAMIEDNGDTKSLEIARTCVKSFQEDGCVDAKYPSNKRPKKFKIGKDCVCKTSGCNAGNPLETDMGSPAPDDYYEPTPPEEVTTPRKGGAKTTTKRGRVLPPRKILMCYTCQTDSNLGCDTLRREDTNSIFYNTCDVKDAKCQFLLTQRMQGGNMRWFYSRKCISWDWVGCTNSDAEDRNRIAFPRNPGWYTYGCVCDINGCNGGLPSQDNLWKQVESREVEEVSNSTDTSGAESSGAESPDSSPLRLFTLIPLCTWIWV